ncbi:MAG: hemerythrin domain-containing protein [Methanosarcinales archaeon]|nr:hemerythrin domain-containing protein [Methanosarcinales archaeon]
MIIIITKKSDPITLLIDEHRIMERVMDVMEKLAEGIEEQRPISSDMILGNIGMLLECNDEYHYGKEEDILLPFLEEIGKNETKELIQSYITKYRENDKLLATIIDSVDGHSNGDMDATIRIMENIREFVRNVRPLYLNEDEEIFKPLKKNLTTEEMDRLSEKFQDFDYEWDGPTLNNYQKLVREMELKASYNVW